MCASMMYVGMCERHDDCIGIRGQPWVLVPTLLNQDLLLFNNALHIQS